MAVVIQLLIAALAQGWVARVLQVFPEGAAPASRLGFRATLREVTGAFAFPNHCANILTGWAQTLDVYVMGLFGVSPTTIGLYSVAQKLANFAQVVPATLINTFSVWVGRQTASVETERRFLRWGTLGIAAFTAAVVGACYLARMPLLEFASKGRWSAEQFRSVEAWLIPLFAAVTVQSGVWTVSAWFTLRRSMGEYLRHVYLPWFVSCALVTLGAALSARATALDALPIHVAYSMVAHPFFFAFWLWVWRSRAPKDGAP
jgi:hypothetical protein